jgi:hypothetical protein
MDVARGAGPVTFDWRTLNPLRLENAGLPPNLVAAARLMAFALVWRGDSVFRLNLPYVEFLDTLAPPDVVNLALRGAAGVGYLFMLFSPFVRRGAGCTGVAYLVGLLACRPCHSVAHTYVACLLIVLALSSWASRERLLRAQVVILYAGAALNKSLDGDWWNGRYFDALMIGRYDLDWYAQAAALPEGWLSIGMGASTVVLQWVLAACFTCRRSTTAGIGIGTVFHGAMVAMLGTTFGPFFAALLVSYLGLGWRPAAGAEETSLDDPPQRAQRQREPHPGRIG